MAKSRIGQVACLLPIISTNKYSIGTGEEEYFTVRPMATTFDDECTLMSGSAKKTDAGQEAKNTLDQLAGQRCEGSLSPDGRTHYFSHLTTGTLRHGQTTY